MALNRVLPLDLAVQKCTVENQDFHSRFCAQNRFYRYRIASGGRDPLKSRFVHQYWDELDLPAMKRSAKALIGEHDFKAFTEELDPSINNTTRKLFAVNVRAVRDETWIDIVGTAFLRGMMRRIAGALFEIGRGIRPENDTTLLLTPERQKMHLPVVLPARGLTLMRVRYGRHPRDNRTVDEAKGEE
jgi:tRNA pseudouridine38-40 synthase